MRSNRLGVLLLLATACVILIQCGGAETEDGQRKLSFISQEDTRATDAAAIVDLQRDLFARLTARQNVAVLTTDRFTIRRDRATETDADSVRTAELRYSRTLEALNARAPLDTSALAEAGDLTAYTDFQTYPLGARQIVVLARRKEGPVALTNWIRHGAEWRAIGILLDPSEATLASLHEQWSRHASR